MILVEMDLNGYRYSDPCFVFVVTRLLKLKVRKDDMTQGLVYHRSSTLMLIEQRQWDEELDRIAGLVMSLQKLRLATLFQKRVRDETLYCVKPHLPLTRDHIAIAKRQMDE